MFSSTSATKVGNSNAIQTSKLCSFSLPPAIHAANRLLYERVKVWRGLFATHHATDNLSYHFSSTALTHPCPSSTAAHAHTYPARLFLVLSLLWLRRIEIPIGNRRPVHARLSRSVHETRVDLAEGLIGMVVEPSRYADTCRPHLYMTHRSKRVGVKLHVEADEVKEFEALVARKLNTGRI